MQLFGGKVPVPPPNGLGSQYSGTHFNDNMTGGVAGDVIAGYGGDDVLYGGLGTNSILGGLGNDTLISTGVRDYLAGGVGADTYDITQSTQGAVLKDIGGSETARFELNFYEYTFSRRGNDLITNYSAYGEDEKSFVIEGHFTATRAVETFFFAGQSYLKSFVENIASGDTVDPGSPNNAYSVIASDESENNTRYSSDRLLNVHFDRGDDMLRLSFASSGTAEADIVFGEDVKVITSSARERLSAKHFVGELWVKDEFITVANAGDRGVTSIQTYET